MRGKVLTFAILSTLSAGAMAGGLFHNNQTSQDRIGPNTRVPDGAAVVSSPLMVQDQPASTGSSAYAAPAPAYATPANPPIATTVVQPAPVWVTQGVAQSGPGATDKTRPGYPDDNTGHSAWDVGTSSAGG